MANGKKPKKKLTRQVCIRMSEADWRQFSAAAKAMERDLSEWIRMVLVGRIPNTPPNP
jgi:predicted HicB family RNase H-like nuclease